jgi:hypothetical protein
MVCPPPRYTRRRDAGGSRPPPMLPVPSPKSPFRFPLPLTLMSTESWRNWQTRRIATPKSYCRQLWVRVPGGPATASNFSDLLCPTALKPLCDAKQQFAKLSNRFRFTGRPTRGAGGKGSGSPRRLAFDCEPISASERSARRAPKRRFSRQLMRHLTKC